MGREATDMIPVKPETKNLVDELKDDGVTYDYFQRELIEVYQAHASQ